MHIINISHLIMSAYQMTILSQGQYVMCHDILKSLPFHKSGFMNNDTDVHKT